MASGTINGTVQYNSSYMSFGLDWSAASNGSDANTSTLTVTVRWKTTKQSKSWDTAGTRTGNYTRIYINGVLAKDDTYDKRFNCNPWPSNSTFVARTTTYTVQHNNDGTPPTVQIEAYANGKASSGGTNYGPGNSNVAKTAITLDNIPRYANLTSFNVNKVNETSLNVTWSADAACDAVWYALNNGSYVAASGTNFNITGLSANTSYNVKIKIKRTDSQLSTESGNVAQTTYAYPYVISAPNFIIGNQNTVTIHNPLGRSCQIYLINPANTEKSGGTTTGTTMAGFNNSAWTDFLYAGIPDSKTGMYKVRLVCSEIGRDTTVNGGNYTVNENDCKPNVANCAATYTANLTNLTNNNQTVINGASTITYRITTGATTTKSAGSISGYVVTWGNSTPQTITNISSSASLVKGSGNTISVTVVDSRGVTNTFSTLISEVIDYTTPTGLAINPTRLNGIEQSVYLDVSGTIYYDKFGTNGVSNKVASIKYSITGESAQNVSLTLTGLSYSSQSSTTHTQKFTINDRPIFKDGVSAGFDTSKTYNISVVVTDTGGGTATINGIIKDGKFALVTQQDNSGEYHFGFNGLPDDNYVAKLHGDVKITGNVEATNITPFSPLDVYPIGSVYISVNNTNPGTLFGGTWQQLNGYYLYAGNGNSTTNFTGMHAQSTTLTAAQSGVPAHGHSFSGTEHKIQARACGTGTAQSVSAYQNTTITENSGDTWSNTITTQSKSHQTDVISWTDGGTVNNNGAQNASQGHTHNIATLEVYVWKRTA